MRCPRCGEMAPQCAAICDNCDEILDSSFLGADDVTPVAGERTDVGPAPTISHPHAQHPTDRAVPAPSPADEARKAAADLGYFFRSLGLADRWAAGASALLLLALALPWRWTREDEEVIGLVTAWPVLFLGIAALALVYLRSRRAGAAQDRELRLAQLAVSGGTVIFTVFAVRDPAPQLGAYLGLVLAVAALFAAIPGLKRG